MKNSLLLSVLALASHAALAQGVVPPPPAASTEAPATITVDFATRVGRVTATEIDDVALSLSQTLAAERGLTNIDFSVEDVHALGFPDDTFDIVHAHQVLQHVGDPVQALREMRRVAKPGGIVAARDADYAGFLWFPLLPELDEWLALYSAAARANGGEPDAGRRLVDGVSVG